MELILPNSGLTVYEPFRARLEELKERENGLAFDYASAKGKADALAHIKDFKESLKALEKTRKEAGEQALRLKQKIDGEAREIRVTIEGFIEKHQAPLDAIEKAEAERVAECQAKIEFFKTVGSDCLTSKDVLAMLDDVRGFTSDAEYYQDLQHEVLDAQSACIERLEKQLAATIQKEADAAELERLRQEKAERDEKERFAKEEAKKEELRKQVEQEIARRAAEAEKVRIAAINERIARIRDAGSNAVESSVLYSTLSKVDAISIDDAFGEFLGEAQAAKDAAKARLKRMAENAKAAEEATAALAAIKEQQLKIEAAAKAQREKDELEAKEKKKREADIAHRAYVRGKIAEDLRKANGDIEKIADMLVDGQIFNTRVVF